MAGRHGRIGTLNSKRIRSQAESSFGEIGGCRVCNNDDDHANVILCDQCNDEYHIYCLEPPLESIPTGDWFCHNCKPPKYEKKSKKGDGLERMVECLPPTFTSRFGEIVWAAGGVGFGWWPGCIYDPRLTVGSARALARKNLGKKHLVYFFECHEAPFAVMTKVLDWESGIAEEYHLGKAARASGKVRREQFEHALQAAIMEQAKPIDTRLEWNHTSPEPATPKKKKPEVKQEKPRHQENKVCTRRNLNYAIDALASGGGKQEEIDGELYLKIIERSNTQGEALAESIGFVKLESRFHSTFASARAAIEEQLDIGSFSFYVPNLGPMSVKQEKGFGCLLDFLRNSTSDPRLGDGSLRNPLKVVVDIKKRKSRETN